LEVSGPDGEVGKAGPDEVAGRGEDVGRGLQGPVACPFGVAGEGRDEEVPWGDVWCCWYGNVEFWGREVGTGFELPVCFDCGEIYDH
jgi:hypothetical protein